MYLDVLLTACMADGRRLWGGTGLGKLCDRGGLFHTGCANIVLVQKMERIVKLSDLPLIGPEKALGCFHKQSTQVYQCACKVLFQSAIIQWEVLAVSQLKD